MKNILIICILVIFSSCAELQQASTQALYQTQSSLIATTTRKVQNGVEKKIDKTINKMEKKAADKKAQKQTERDSIPK